MTKLTPSQLTALQFVATTPWVATWWGGKPYGRWPKELNARSVSKLINLKLARLTHVGRFDRALTITAAGLEVLTSAITETAQIELKRAIESQQS